jgi:hypothetical protein
VDITAHDWSRWNVTSHSAYALKTQVAQDVTRKRHKSRNVRGVIVTNVTYIESLQAEEVEKVQAATQAAARKVERECGKLQRVVATTEAAKKKDDAKLQLLSKHSGLLEAAKLAVLKGETFLTVSHLHTLIVSRQGKLSHGNKPQLVRAATLKCKQGG